MHSSPLKRRFDRVEKTGWVSPANSRTRYFDSGRHEISPGWSANGEVGLGSNRYRKVAKGRVMLPPPQAPALL
jgi:hypothetical protein